tara:strand:+ start:57 stop:305 length:249 start_codon:yes stop_codon:yes gene_type:complete
MNIFRILSVIWFISFCLGFATGCSYTPVVDLRASKNEAQLYQRDLMECKLLAKEVDWPPFPAFRAALNNCLDGRGHSVLNGM